MQTHAQCVPALFRCFHEFAKRLSDQRYFIRQSNVAADQQKSRPIGRMREMFCVLNGLHGLSKSSVEWEIRMNYAI